MELDSRQTIILAVLVLFLGRFLNGKIQFLQKYNIPEPVTGGVIASVLFSCIYLIFDQSVNFSLKQRDILLVIFFTCVGLSARFSTLLKGGKALITLLIIAVCYLFIQNITGVGVALLTGLPPQVGVLGSSVSLSGGHGTAIAWAPIFAESFNIDNAMEIGIACATFGLVLGGICGGPIANHLINKHQLSSSSNEQLSVGFAHEEEKITVNTIYTVLLILCIAIGIGIHLHQYLQTLGITLPIFVPCLFGGIILTNTVPLVWKSIPWPSGTPTLALISDFSLGLFLAMSLMSLQLWTLIDLAMPILLLLLAQVLVITLFTIFIVFKALGKNYDAAVIASGYAGLGLGATPTAIANMTAVTKKYGASPQAFIVIPLIGAFFIDISNAIIIQWFMNWLV
ncbi:sodium/glutamate symporter [Litorilituus lipolyticus]|uniref:Sodium/glutamate symporter n=1 Tax=Litorilituus lipolyticus TaxID=2491017 RepID=A0A502L067_9GAMM|nr:sodium/glutamate symporter [Litorilituus lipolyticus]TPH17298.1 sodium/glutamate symporter [Litorilituus lipolyticus]